MPISSALGSSALLPAGLGFRNLIINGNMVVDQRNTANSPITNAVNTNTYGLDRWIVFGAASRLTMSQSTDVPSSDVFTKSLKITTAASSITPASGDFYGIRQIIEGQNFAVAGYGTSAAKPLVLSFWVKCSLAGTYSVTLLNREVPDRTYVTTYTINNANTWEKKYVYFLQGDTSGTWLTTNGIGLQLWWDLGTGSSWNATPNVWNASLKANTSAQPNFAGSNAGTFYITGVQLEQNYQPTPFEQRPYGVELALCQRYYWRSTTGLTTDAQARHAHFRRIDQYAYIATGHCAFPVVMRTEPTVSLYNGNGLGAADGYGVGQESYVIAHPEGMNQFGFGMLVKYTNSSLSTASNFNIAAATSTYWSNIEASAEL